jgi:FkbM family methyltransferase
MAMKILFVLLAQKLAAAALECNSNESMGATMLQTKAVPSKSKETPLCPAGLNDCDFDTEVEGEKVDCVIEHISRTMYGRWINHAARVLEVGARYGQSTCALSQLLEPHGRLVSVEADPAVWHVLERNLASKACKAQVIRGVMGPEDVYLIDAGYGSRLAPKEKNSIAVKKVYKTWKHPDGAQAKVSPHHTIESLGIDFDVLALDCEGCFGNFLYLNPAIMKELKMIVVEVHNDDEEAEVERIQKEGWKLVESSARQRVLCRGPCMVQNHHCQI